MVGLVAWLYELCEPLAKRVVVVQAAKKQGPKSDSIDAWSLAGQMRRGELDRFVFKQPGTYRPLREAVRCYDGAFAGETGRPGANLVAECRSSVFL